MNGSLIADIVYYIVLYSALALLALPVIYFSLWKFLGFFKKNKSLFYVMSILMFGGVIAGFYFNQAEWILWYYAFPQYVQIAGLVLFAGSFMLMRIVDHQLGFRTRFFWEVLKDRKFELSTRGMFRLVRHPIYALVPVLIIGALMYTGELVLVFPLIFNVLTRRWYAKKEENHMKSFAGDEYGMFMKQTPNRFWPRLKASTVAAPR